MKRQLSAVTLALLTWMGARSASAYRTLQNDPDLDATEPVVWSEPHVAIELATSASLSDAQRASVENELLGALAAWSRLECSMLTYSYERGRAPDAVPEDGRNTVQWVGTRWTARGFDPTAAATTDVQLARDTASGSPWRIVEADVYVNADSVEWRPLSANPEAAHLAGALTHEIAHVHGMSHPCEIDGTTGAPACSSSAEYLESVLFPIHVEGAHQPGPDDVAGTCTLYPRSTCTEPCAFDEVCWAERCEPAFDHTECPECSVCLEPADCADEMTCTYGRCVEIADLGQPCARDVDCRSGLCERNRCTRPCDTEECPAGLSCEGDPPLCVVQSGVDRSDCASGEECRTALCLHPSEGGPGHCTNGCTSDAACLHDEACQAVDGEQVCVPMSSAAGCSVYHGAPPPFLLSASILALFLLPLRRRRRSRPGRAR